MLPFAFNSAARPSLDLVRLVALLAGLALTGPVAAQVDMERMPDTTQSPPASVSAFLHSIIGASVFSRSSFTMLAVISAIVAAPDVRYAVTGIVSRMSSPASPAS